MKKDTDLGYCPDPIEEETTVEGDPIPIDPTKPKGN